MKEIKAIIQPFMLSKVTSALQRIADFPGMTVSKAQGFGRGRAKDAPHRIVEDLIDYVPKTKIEIVVNDDMIDEVIKAIMENAHTGNKGDGKVFIYEVEHVIKIKTGELDENGV